MTTETVDVAVRSGEEASKDVYSTTAWADVHVAPAVMESVLPENVPHAASPVLRRYEIRGSLVASRVVPSSYTTTTLNVTDVATLMGLSEESSPAGVTRLVDPLTISDTGSGSSRKTEMFFWSMTTPQTLHVTSSSLTRQVLWPPTAATTRQYSSPELRPWPGAYKSMLLEPVFFVTVTSEPSILKTSRMLESSNSANTWMKAWSPSALRLLSALGLASKSALYKSAPVADTSKKRLEVGGCVTQPTSATTARRRSVGTANPVTLGLADRM